MNIVITGSTKGIGKALAKKFLSESDNVIISSRNQSRVDSVVEEFSSEFSGDKIFGIVCDVTIPEQIDSLIRFAQEKFVKIDIWINNAGTNGFNRAHLVDVKVSTIKTVIETNILGTLLCCRAVLKVMIEQKSGHIFNMEGLGAKGNTMANLLVYATSKRAIPMIMKTLLLETQGLNVGIHDLSPGMVLTDLILKNTPPETRKFMENIASKPETVADYLVPRIRSIEGTGKTIQFQRNA